MAALADKFPQSIRRDSSELVIRIGARRYALAEQRDRMRTLVSDPVEVRRLERVYRVAIREAA